VPGSDAMGSKHSAWACARLVSWLLLPRSPPGGGGLLLKTLAVAYVLL
jgi:hypothetical protein